MYKAPRKYKCSQCGPIKRPINWYKLKTKVQDATGTMNLMIFCEVAEELVGVSAEELVDEIEDDDEWYTLPDEIEDLFGSTHTFQVFDKHGTGSFSVYSIMDHVSVPGPAASTAQCKEESVPEGSCNVAVPSPTTTQCKVEPVIEESVNTAAPTPTLIRCKEEPATLDTVNVAVAAPTLTQCKEEPVLQGNVTMAIPALTTTRCKEEPFLEDSVNRAVLVTTATQCKEEPVVEDIVSMAVPAPATKREVGPLPDPEDGALQKPSKRLRGDGWIN